MKACHLIFFLFITSYVGVADSYGQQANSISDSITITGIVVDELLNEPIINAIVMIIDDNNALVGTVTDFDGKFALKIPTYIANKTTSRINVKYIGRLSESKTLRELQNLACILFVMRPDPKLRMDSHIGRFRVPLIDEFSGGHVKTMTSYEIEKGAY